MPYTNFPHVSDILAGVSQDIRLQLSATVDPGKTILIDYTNRVHKQVLRFSRWTFLLSLPQYFLTEQGQSKYWLGSPALVPAGVVDSGLNLSDVDKIKKDSVLDVSNVRQLKWLANPPYGPTLNDRTGAGRVGLPATFLQNPNNPNQLEIYPPPNNENTSQPVPMMPITITTAGGALGARSYFVKITYVDSAGGESTSTPLGVQRYIAASNLLKVRTPELPFAIASSGVTYNKYNVYASITEGSETLQNASPITIGTDWTEPTGGLITSGASVPTTNSLAPLGAYLIKFEYYVNRATLTATTDLLQVPEDYKDVIINGVSAYAYKLLGKSEEASACYQLYRAGLTEMIWDKNLFPEGVEFMRPDSSTYVNNQILGYLPPFFVALF